MRTPSEVHAAVAPLLETAREQGINSGEIDEHIDHALAFAGAWLSFCSESPTSAVDLGSGGGLPALPLIAAWPDCQWVLVEGRERRATFLGRAVRALGTEDRVTIWNGDAQALSPDLYGTIDLVTARLFAAPAIVAECAGPLLAARGRIVVSEPEVDEALTRWPIGPLHDLGLAPTSCVVDGRPFSVLARHGDSPSAPPRRRARMERSPAF